MEQNVKPLLTNLSKTGDLPHHQINSIADLIDEGKISPKKINVDKMFPKDE